jgi:hypothetical protein
MRFTYITLALTLALALGACRKGPTKPERIDDFNEAGWALFESSRFAEALQEFSDGLELDADSTNVSGHVGKGWCLLLLGSEDSTAIVAALTVGNTSAEWDTAAWCGLAAARLNQEYYAAADTLAGLALAADSKYVFIKFTSDEEINWRDLLVIQAEARFFTIDYDGAWQAIVPLLVETDSPVYLPNGDLDRTDPDTWKVNGTTFALYEEALASVIFKLVRKYRLE